MEDDAAARLLRERERRKLFWVDANAVRVFYKWMRAPAGRSLERCVHIIYARHGITPLFPSFLDELRHFSLSGRHVDKVRYDIWEVIFENEWYLSPSFIRLVLDLCLYPEPIGDLEIVPDWRPIECVWSNPALGFMISFLNSLTEEETEEITKEYYDRIDKIVCYLKPQIDNTSQSVQVQIKPLHVFDVTEPLCQLFSMWILAKRSHCVTEAVELKLAEFLLQQNDGVELEDGATLSPIETLATTFLVNNSPHLTSMTSAQLKELEMCLQFREGTVYQAGHVHGPITTSFSAELVRDLIRDIRASKLASVEAPSIWIDRCSSLRFKAELHSTVLELKCATRAMSNLYYSWLRCTEGRGKHKVMVDRINEAYTQQGLPLCRNSSFVQEVKHTLASFGHLSHESARARYEIWRACMPSGICSINGEQSFVNFVAAVCSHEDSSSHADWRLDDLWYWASSGSYHVLKPVLIQAGDDDKTNTVVSYFLLDLRSQAYGAVFNMNLEYSKELPEIEEEFDHVFPEVNLPDCTRASVERGLDGPTIVLCRNVTQPILRVLSTWLRRHGSNAPLLGCLENGKDLESLWRCWRIHGSIAEEATEKDIEAASRAASEDKFALVTGGQEVGPCIARLVQDLITNSRNKNVFLKARKTISKIHKRSITKILPGVSYTGGIAV